MDLILLVLMGALKHFVGLRVLHKTPEVECVSYRISNIRLFRENPVPIQFHGLFELVTGPQVVNRSWTLGRSVLLLGLQVGCSSVG